MTLDMHEYISTCETCSKLTTEHPKDTLMSHSIPDRPWHKVDVDLFEFESVEYLITVNYLSNF